MKNKFKYLLAIIITTVIGLLTLLGPLSMRIEASGFVDNGKWEFQVDKDLPMGASYFSDTVIVERENNNYYLTFSILDKGNVDRMSLVKGSSKVGVIERRNGKRIDYTFTVSEEDLLKPLTFRCYIVAMQKEKEFNVTIKPETKAKISDTIDDLGERPALFVPVISVNAGDSEMNFGSFYQVMPAKAKIASKEIPVEAKAYYLVDGERTPVEIKDNRFMLDSIGEYQLVYKALSSLYKTSYGNSSSSEIVVKIISKINATSLAKVENIEGNKALADNISVQAIEINESNESFSLINEKMKNISNHYSAINVTIYDIDGRELKLEDEVNLYLYANPTLDRTKLQVYHMDSDGELTLVANENYGRYVRIKANDLGTYVILVPGVPFVMPMWGIATITLVGAVALIGGISAIAIVIVKRKRKNKNLESIN